MLEGILSEKVRVGATISTSLGKLKRNKNKWKKNIIIKNLYYRIYNLIFQPESDVFSAEWELIL